MVLQDINGLQETEYRYSLWRICKRLESMWTFFPCHNVNLFSLLAHSEPSRLPKGIPVTYNPGSLLALLISSRLQNLFRSLAVHTASCRFLCPQDFEINSDQLQSRQPPGTFYILQIPRSVPVIYSLYNFLALFISFRPCNLFRSSIVHTVFWRFLCLEDSRISSSDSISWCQPHDYAHLGQLSDGFHVFMHIQFTSYRGMDVRLEGTGIMQPVHIYDFLWLPCLEATVYGGYVIGCGKREERR